MSIVAIASLEAFHEWQRTFDPEIPRAYMLDHVEIPIFCAFGYMAFVVYGQAWMRTGSSPTGAKAQSLVRLLAAIWNLLLAVFSIVGALITLPYLLHVLGTKGFHHTICTEPASKNYHNPTVWAWVMLFCLSKIPELIDTVWLVLQRKPIVLLQWFHHLTVMLYCWHSFVVFSPTGLWFATMNYIVHAFMYSYFFLTYFPSARRVVRKFALLITTLQIAQMIAGIGISIAAFMKMNNSGHGSSENSLCSPLDPANCKMGLVMYISYFALFAEFFYNSYIVKKISTKAAEATAQKKRE